MVVTAVDVQTPSWREASQVPVPRLWPGATVVCLGSGPSLTQDDVAYCRGRSRVIAIKNTIELAPWADVLYGAGADGGGHTWWQRQGRSLEHTGLRYTLDARSHDVASVLKIDRDGGLSDDPGKLCTGHHSGYQAIGLAVHLGAAKIVLLGYDMQPTGGEHHYFGRHPHGRGLPYDLFLYWFPTIVEPLKARGVTVVNASRQTALDIFPRMRIEEALA